jgi:hypothetical protein
VDQHDTSDETGARPAPAPRATRASDSRALAPRKTAAATSEAPAVDTSEPTAPAPASPTQVVEAVPVSPARPVDAVTPSRGQPAASGYEPGPYRVGDPRPMPAAPTTPAGPPPAPAPVRRSATNVYRARRPAFAALLIVPAVAAGLLLVKALAEAAFGATFVLTGVIASCLGLAALPLLVTGLYGLLTGAAYGAEQVGFRVWARPPLAYLLVGIAFVIGAAIAA